MDYNLDEIDLGLAEIALAEAPAVPPARSRFQDLMAARGFQMWIRGADPAQIPLAVEEMVGRTLSEREQKAFFARFAQAGIATPRANASMDSANAGRMYAGRIFVVKSNPNGGRKL